ncbi:colicin transporter [Mameliella alba]|nr:colicin transporter [Antarctobacter heliothermus]MBY6144073.1 colicin transporter [Mameliella alba]MCA0954122.1 colicin transporter [Mameliella alba]
MSQIEDLQARITRALDRIGQGIDGIGATPVSPDFDALRGRAEAAEQALAEAQEALAAARDQAEIDRDAAVAEAVERAEAEREAALVALRHEADTERDAALAALREQAEADRTAAIAAIRAEAEEALERARAEAGAEAEVQTAPVTEGAPPDVAALEEALEDEKMANAQLEERLRVLRARLEEVSAAAPAEAPKPETLAALDAELQKLRAANDELVTTNAALREANAQGVGDPELINRGLQAELEALRAARAAEAAEATAVIGALTPLLADAAEGEMQG